MSNYKQYSQTLLQIIQRTKPTTTHWWAFASATCTDFQCNFCEEIFANDANDHPQMIDMAALEQHCVKHLKELGLLLYI